MRKGFLIVFSLLLNFLLIGQSKYQNERNILMTSQAADSLKMDAAYKISKDICFMYPDSGVWYGKQALQFAKSAKISKGEASALSQVGFSFYQQDKLDSAIFYWNQSIDIYKENKDEFNAASILNNIALQYIFNGEYEEAQSMLDEVEATMIRLDSAHRNLNTYTNMGLLYDLQGDYIEGQKYYRKAIQIAEERKDTSAMADNINNIAVMYYYLDDFENVIKYSREVLAYGDIEKLQPVRSKVYLNMAVSFEQLDKLDSAIFYNTKALALTSRLKNELDVSKIYHNLGCLYTETGDIKEGLVNLLKAKEIKEKMPQREGIASTYTYLGYVYTLKGDYDQALYYLNKGNSTAQASNIPVEKKESYEYFSKYYKAIGDYKNAYQYLSLYNNIRDSIQNADVKIKVADLELRYETVKKDAENQALRVKQTEDEITIAQHQKMLFFSLIGILMLCTLLWIIYKQKERQKKLTVDIAQQKDQIQLLNRELNHRVKNNLAFMTSLLEMQGRRTESAEVKDALQESETRLKALALVHSQLFRSESDTVVNLKTYLQEVTSHLQDIFITKESPIGFVTDYADHNVNAEDAMRLGLIVNELVTNSVKHAFTSITNPIINISTAKDPQTGKLVLKYEDNGPKFTMNPEDSKVTTSLGLKLISLLKKQLGERYIVAA